MRVRCSLGLDLRGEVERADVRIATWNVNSLKARLDKVTGWLERARPDVLLMQETKLAWFDRLARWLAEAADPAEPLALGGDLNVAPEDIDVWSPQACHGGTHVSPAERDAFARLCRWGLIDVYRQHHPEPGRYTWWDYRAGNFHKNFGMRIDHLLATRPVAGRTVWAEIDREARKGKPIPSDHAPLVIDLDQPGHPFDAGWTSAERRIAARRAGAR